MAEHFKGRVHQWFTFNEPACIVKMGYGTGEHAPGLKLPLEGQFTCWRNVIYAHCLAAQELRHADPENKVGFVSTGRICYPVSEAKTDVDAARVLTFACPDDDWAFTHTMHWTRSVWAVGRNRTSADRDLPPASPLCRSTSTMPCLWASRTWWG